MFEEEQWTQQKRTAQIQLEQTFRASLDTKLRAEMPQVSPVCPIATCVFRLPNQWSILL